MNRGMIFAWLTLKVWRRRADCREEGDTQVAACRFARVRKCLSMGLDPEKNDGLSDDPECSTWAIFFAGASTVCNVMA